MRGGDERSGELFSYVDLEKRVRADHPLRAIRAIVNEALAALEREFRGALCADRAAVDPAGEAASGDAVAGVLLDPLGAAADGAAGVRSAVPLVRRASGSTMRPGTIRPSRRTATGCWKGISRRSSWPRCWRSRG